jgi:hypothetical protein
MFLITCPVTKTDELVADRRIVSVVNRPTHIAMSVACPACGQMHVYRTGRHWDEQRHTARQAAEPASA